MTHQIVEYLAQAATLARRRTNPIHGRKVWITVTGMGVRVTGEHSTATCAFGVDQDVIWSEIEHCKINPVTMAIDTVVEALDRRAVDLGHRKV